MSKGKGSAELKKIADKTWAKYFKNDVNSSDAAKKKKELEGLLKERALKTQRSKKELTKASLYTLEKAYRKAYLDHTGGITRPPSPRKPVEKRKPEEEPEGQPPRKEQAVEPSKALDKVEEELNQIKQDMAQLDTTMQEQADEIQAIIQDFETVAEDMTARKEEERARKKQEAFERRSERRRKLKEARTPLPSYEELQGEEEGLPSYEELQGETKEKEQQETVQEEQEEHPMEEVPLEETKQEEPKRETFREHAKRVAIERERARLEANRKRRPEEELVKEEPNKVLVEEEEGEENQADVDAIATDTVEVDNMSTVAVKSEPTGEQEEDVDVTEGLKEGATTNGTDESLVRGENPEGAPIPPTAGATTGTQVTPQNVLEHYPGDTGQEQYSVTSNAQPTLPDNPDVPVANSDEINQNLQEYGQPMETEEPPNLEQQQQAQEQALEQANAETVEKQEAIAIDPDFEAARHTVEKGMDGVDFFRTTYFGGDDDFGEFPEEKMKQAKKLPAAKLPPTEGKMETDVAERQAEEKERNTPQTMQAEETGGPPVPQIDQEPESFKKQRLANEEAASQKKEIEQAATNALNPKRGGKRLIYYDPKDSSVYVTMPSGPTPEVTRNPFELKPDFEHFKTREEAILDAKRRVGLQRVAQKKDVVMQHLEFFTRSPSGGEYERKNLRQIFGERNKYWSDRQKQILEYEKHTEAQKAEILARWRKEDKIQLDQEEKENKAMRSAREIQEYNDFVMQQFDKLQSNFTLENANKKFLYPSLIDKNSRNVIEFAKDANGDYLRDPVTGGPIITSMWSVERDDAERLRQQRAVADGMIQKKPYFPIFGKAAKKFFSKAEYCQLARMMGQDGNPYPETIMRTEKTIDRKLNKLYAKLKKAMNLPPLPQDETKKKVLLELQTLEQAFSQYSVSALYDYPNTLEQADQDNADKEQFESAVKTLEKITMGKLLQQLAERKASEIQERRDREDLQSFYDQGRQDLAQERFPTFGHNVPGKTATYTGVGQGPNPSEFAPTNPADQTPDEEAVSRLTNFLNHHPDDNGEPQRQAESRFQYADPIEGIDLDVSAPSSGIPGSGLALPAASAEEINRIGEPQLGGKRQVNPMGRTGFGGGQEEKQEVEYPYGKFTGDYAEL